MVVLGLSALGFGLVAARCFDLILSADWWTPPEPEAHVDEVAAITGVDERGSLELPEEGPEEGGVRA